MNELANLEFNVSYTPSEITIQNEEQLKLLVAKTTEHYSSLIFDHDNIPEAKKARADLNKIVTMLDNQRKTVKKSYNEPLKAFEEKLKAYTAQVKETSENINQSIRTFEDGEKEKRLNKITELIEEVAVNYEVEPAEIEIESAWLNVASFTKGGEPTKKTLEEVTSKMTLVSNEKKRVLNEKTVIANYAKAVELDAESWVSLVDYGKAAPEIMCEMDQAVVNRRKQKELEEQQKAQQAEYETAMKKLREQQVDEVLIDKETGEILSEPENEAPSFDEELANEFDATEKEMTVVLKLTGTETKLRLLNQYIIDNGIGVEAM